VDTVDSATRSRMMSGIRGSNTKIEMLVRRALHARGLRYRLHSRKLPGRPDMAFASARAAVFMNGCFWHGHDCPLFRLPGTNTEFWRSKIDGNRARDVRSLEALHSQGWRTAVVWECAMRGRPVADFEHLIAGLEAWLRTGMGNIERRGPVSAGESQAAPRPAARSAE
jgi:DNA mismatch endonuclease (patch repair protein)